MKNFNQLSLILMIFTFVLIAAGGLVTSTGSGLSVPDWPLSFGKLFPVMTGGVQFEHTHRVIAGVVLLLTIALSWIARKEVSPVLRNITWVGLTSVLIQALLGGLTVLYLLPTSISVLHACLGQSFFALVVALWWMSGSPEASAKAISGISSDSAGIRKLLGKTTITVLLVQLFLGAYVRHSGGRAVVEHIGGAFLVTACVTALAILTQVVHSSDRRLKLASMILLGLLVMQIALGYGSFVWTVLRPAAEILPLERVLITNAHQTMGALILAFSMVLTLAAHPIHPRSEPQRR